MKQIKLVKGNDVTFRIEVTQKEGNTSLPVDFNGVTDLAVYMHNSGKRKMDVTATGNIITMPVRGSEQLIGDVGVEAVWGDNSHRFFYKSVCCFVNTTDEADYLHADDVSVETVNLSAVVFTGSAGLSSGKSPYVGENGNWFEFSDTDERWTDTGIKAAGQKGDKGDRGEQGFQGIPGAQGIKGDSGERGLQGAAGVSGAKGERGEKGEAGINGTAGKDAPLPQVQYSADGSAWHTAKTDSDIYWRMSVDGGINWGNAVFFKDTVLISAETAAVKTIKPGIFYVWGEMPALDITLAPPSNTTILNEYMFQFNSGDPATTLALPVSVIFPSEVKIKAGKTYQVSIVNNLGVIGEF